eukprot:CAMPEP_0197664568 /NCGR_PEP_ID=MMETSP1338-20131121/58718_1 /TAXON_ID=43686 ORGANISM="Pelagodinium beii, Strain RCC1491" /NCGR_SAMPLE_ID=MMETSP1338 /ASSEMBLY_ACC=CAM_ASM_000754 /LENGTH=646 /DNA_ID=CAMNT_0043243243 /DNA_START=54 /DNA_END=1991 /DNA_ORIENTATION=+
MPDTELGYYSPNESIQYLPQRERGGNLATGLLGAACSDVKTFFLELQRYFGASFDREFLTSSASRRDLWKFLLPLPGLLAMIGDKGKSELLLLDAGMAVSLFVFSSLPMGWILSDLVFSVIYAAFIPLHSVLNAAPAAFGGASPVTAVVTMAAAGVNVVILASFTILSYVAAPHIAYSWTVEEITVCGYVLLLAMAVERRATLLMTGGDVYSTQLGYKALGLQDDPSRASASRMPVEILNSRYTADTLSRAGMSDGEDSYRPLPKESTGLALVDQLLARFGKSPGSQPGKAGLTSIFSGLGGAATPSVSSRATQSRSRFAAEQVSLPGAAYQEAPQFQDRGLDEELGEPLNQKQQTRERNQPASSAGGTSPTRGGHGTSYLRGIKLGGFANEGLNALFVEKPAPALAVNGRETYWPASGDYFIYRSASTNTWGVGKAKRFQQIKDGKSNGLAHSPEGYEIWVDVNEVPSTPSNSKKSWREWDVELSKWVARDGAGVHGRGKVRPKAGTGSTVEVAVQTHIQVLEKTAQAGESSLVEAGKDAKSKLADELVMKAEEAAKKAEEDAKAAVLAASKASSKSPSSSPREREAKAAEPKAPREYRPVQVGQQPPAQASSSSGSIRTVATAGPLTSTDVTPKSAGGETPLAE